MKYLIFSLFLFSVLTVFSCRGTPRNAKTDFNNLDEAEKTIELSDSQFDEQIDEFILEINETEMIELTQENYEPADESEYIEQNLSELEQQLMDLERLLADRGQRLNELEQRLIDSGERLNENNFEDETEIVITIEEPPAEPVTTQPLQTQQPQAVTQSPPPSPPQTPPQAVTQSPPPSPQVQTPPPVQATPPPAPVQTPPAQTAVPVLPVEAVEETQNIRSEPFPNLPSAPAARIEPLTAQDDVIFSRIVRATVGQTLEIPFRGSGWVYLGELASRRGIVYNSRRNDSDGQSFIFTLEEAGTYALKFYRQDFIRDYILNDHVQVIVGEAPSATTGWFNPPVDRGRVVAQPRWPTAAEEALLQSGSRLNTEPVVSGIQVEPPLAQNNESPQPSASQPPASVTGIQGAQNNAQTATDASAVVSQNQIPASPAAAAIQDETPIVQRLTPEQYLQRAQSSFDAGNVTSAITLLDQFMEQYPGGSDEAFWLLGQFYEANSPNRNILLSLDYYRRLINEYPQSRRFEEARRRIAYIERFYINIR
ncbi:MAG: tetratricopeptide repeat protein [Treponema sp.]|nr:tetratricopeptide repeat protein [Treponema sp.]